MPNLMNNGYSNGADGGGGVVRIRLLIRYENGAGCFRVQVMTMWSYAPQRIKLQNLRLSFATWKHGYKYAHAHE
jgi:hypothetical protein